MSKYGIAVLLICSQFFVGCEAQEPRETENVPIQIQIGENIYSALLYNNPSARTLRQKLPLTLHMHDFNGNEKYLNLPDAFPVNPQSIKQIKSGDIMLHGTNCLVIFYRDFATSYSYTRLGKIENADELSKIVGDGTIQITIR